MLGEILEYILNFILNLILSPIEKVIENPWIIFVFLAAILLIWLPQYQISHYAIHDATVEASLENQYRATLAQIFGGVAIGVGLYYTWRRIIIAEEDLKVTQENLKVSQESQITERFTRAIDQLGNDKIEIKLGGIYALERIAEESEKDYWPIMEILTAYIRKNSSIENKNTNNKDVKKQNKISLEIQSILTVIRRRKYYEWDYNSLDLHETYLTGADLVWTNLERADLEKANLQEANLEKANLQGANLEKANLEMANLQESKLENANLEGASLKQAYIRKAHLKQTNLELANLEEAYLKGAKNLTVDQLSEVKTLYKAQLDEGLEAELRAKGFGHLLDDEPER